MFLLTFCISLRAFVGIYIYKHSRTCASSCVYTLRQVIKLLMKISFCVLDEILIYKYWGVTESVHIRMRGRIAKVIGRIQY